MKIQFATKQMTVPERVYSHAEHRINELDPFFRGTPEAAVVFGAEDGKAVVELTIFAGSTIFRVVEKTSDMMVSIDAAVSSVRRQLRENYARLPKEVNADAFEKETDEVTFDPRTEPLRRPRLSGGPPEELLLRQHDRPGSNPPDEPDRPRLLRLPQRGEGRRVLRGLPPQRRWVRCAGGHRLTPGLRAAGSFALA